MPTAIDATVGILPYSSVAGQGSSCYGSLMTINKSGQLMDMEQPRARTLQVSIETLTREPSADSVMAGITLQHAGGVGFLL